MRGSKCVVVLEFATPRTRRINITLLLLLLLDNPTSSTGIVITIFGHLLNPLTAFIIDDGHMQGTQEVGFTILTIPREEKELTSCNRRARL